MEEAEHMLESGQESAVKILSPGKHPMGSLAITIYGASWWI